MKRTFSEQCLDDIRLAIMELTKETIIMREQFKDIMQKWRESDEKHHGRHEVALGIKDA